jgi:transposase
MKKISKEIENSIISLLDKDHSSWQIAAQLSVSHATVMRVHSKSRPTTQKQKGGRPKKLTVTDKRNIVRNVTSGKVDTTVDLVKTVKESIGIDVGPDTIRRSLKEAGLKAATKPKKPLLLPQHIHHHLEFAQHHQYWTNDDWKRVIWSDETKINRMGSDGREWVWKKPGSGLTNKQVKGTMKFGGGSLMFWGCMTAQGVGYGCRIDGRMDAEVYTSILDDYLLPTIKYYKMKKNHLIFQQDNDPKHTSNAALKWLETKKINTLEWPAQSPDLNPIEHLWDHLKRQLAGYETEPHGILELWEHVEAEWDKIPMEVCVNLIDSMPRRIAAVLKAKGGYTKY